MAFLITPPNLGHAGRRECMQARLNFQDDGATFTFPALPAGTMLDAIHRSVNTTFDDSGADDFIVGTAVDPDGFCILANTDLTTAGMYHDTGGVLVAANGMPQRLAAATALTCVYNGANSDATQGEVDVYVYYTLANA